MPQTKAANMAPKECNRSFAKKIRELRTDMGLTLEDMAHKVGVKMFTYCHWEYARFRPNQHNLRKLAKALGIDLLELDLVRCPSQVTQPEELSTQPDRTRQPGPNGFFLDPLVDNEYQGLFAEK